MAKLTITRGLPACGKTTWSKYQVAHNQKTTRISRDDIRHGMMGFPNDKGIGTHEEEELVTKIQQSLVDEFLCKGWDVIVDDTNLRLKFARAWADLAKRVGADFEVKDFTDVDLQTCINRDKQRAEYGQRSVGESVIRGMHQKFLAKGPLPEVKATEQAALSSKQYVPDETLPAAWIVDIDGTLAHMRSGRSPYDWHRVDEDECNEAIRSLVCSLWVDDYEIIVMSGRDAACRDVTQRWLGRNTIPYHHLYMRAENDHRKDSLVKAELFWEHVAPFYNVIGVLDDRDSVVEMWRGMGLVCCQVAPGAF